MATEIIPIDIALAHVREDAGVADANVQLYLGAAVQSTIDYLNRQVYATDADMAAAVLAGTAGDDPIVVNDAIKAAILLILGRLYDNREDTVVGATVFELPTGSKQLLAPHRTGLGV